MKDAQKPDHVSLNTPRQLPSGMAVSLFQTSSESLNGSRGNVRELMRSIFLDYYIGSLPTVEG